MQDQISRAAAFKALHVPGEPLVLFNIWDAGSARAVESAGARAIATGSWAVACAHGYGDGEALPLDLALRNLERITAATRLPVSIDLEGGYGETPAHVDRTVAWAIAAGAVGCNIEDSLPESRALREPSDQAARLKAARAAAARPAVPFFINARTDVFFGVNADSHTQAMLDEVLERARVYADAGADGLFVPGLADARLISRLVASSPLPVNVLHTPHAQTIGELGTLGVSRVSFGPSPYRALMSELRKAATWAVAA